MRMQIKKRWPSKYAAVNQWVQDALLAAWKGLPREQHAHGVHCEALQRLQLVHGSISARQGHP
eukprot:9116801-Lingulodinium_polyedra.AAC.1